MFLVNSRYPLLCATSASSSRKGFHQKRSSFFRSYGGNLPSSLTIVLPIALVFSTRPPVSVWGTGTVPTHCRAFLGSMGSVTSPVAARHHVSGLRPQLSSGPPYTPRTRWYWNINQLCIDYASRPRLSSRLTLGGLAFPRNPWAFGGGVSHPSLATHACILTRWRSTTDHSEASRHHRRSSTAPASRGRTETHSFGSGLEPRYIVRAGSLDQ